MVSTHEKNKIKSVFIYEIYIEYKRFTIQSYCIKTCNNKDRYFILVMNEIAVFMNFDAYLQLDYLIVI